MPNNVPRDSAEYIAAIALREAGGNYQQASDTIKLAAKLLARWKLLDIIDRESTNSAPIHVP